MGERRNGRPGRAAAGALAALLALATTALGAEPESAPAEERDRGAEAAGEGGRAAYRMDELVVTPGRTEQRLGDVPANVTVLGRGDLRRSAAPTVDDLLRQIPGFSLFRRSSSRVANPTTQGVTLRGIAPSGVSRSLVLLDGVPLNDPFGGWVYWGRVPKESVERI